MIKIGLFIDAFYPMVDGVVEVVNNYAKRMNDKDFSVVVFAPMPRNKKYVDNFPYKVVRCKSMKVPFLDYDLSMPALDRKFKKAIKENNLDLIHIHSPFAIGHCGVKYAVKHNIPVIATLHSQFKMDFMRATHSKLLTNYMLRRIMKVYNKCDDYFAVNGKIAEIYHDYGTNNLPKVLRNGTDMQTLDNPEQAIKLVNEKFAIKNDTPVFLFVGRINKLKNIFFTLEALEKLHNKNFKMIFVGEGQDMQEFAEAVKKSSVADNVIFTGKITDRQLLTAIYLRAKLFLFPSTYDASSLVQIEAASQKTPTVFLKGTATSATVTDNVNGFISEPNTSAFAAKIEQVLQDKKLYQTVSEGAYRDLYVRWDDLVVEQKKLYKKLIANKKNKSDNNKKM